MLVKLQSEMDDKMIASPFLLAFVLLCGFAAIRDLNTLTIPNWLNGWLAFLFLPVCLLVLPGWEVFGAHLLTGLTALVLTFALFSLGVFGGGDAKMIPAVLLWIGPAPLPAFLQITAISGGVLTLVLIGLRSWVPQPGAPGFAYEALRPGAGVPYGVAIAIGAVLTLPGSLLFQQI